MPSQDNKSVDSSADKNFNKIAIAVGLVLFTVSIFLTIFPAVVSQTTIVVPIFVSCAAIGIILYAVGSEANLSNPGVRLTGAAAISVLTFMLIMREKNKADEITYHGTLVVRADAAQLIARMENDDQDFKPVAAVLTYDDISTSGIVGNYVSCKPAQLKVG